MRVRDHPLGRTVLLSAILPLLLVSLWSTPTSANTFNVVELEIKDGIGVATADYVRSGIEHAVDVGADLVIITMDTPGGLITSLRDINLDHTGIGYSDCLFCHPNRITGRQRRHLPALRLPHAAAWRRPRTLGAATPVQVMGAPALDLEQEKKRKNSRPRWRKKPSTMRSPTSAAWRNCAAGMRNGPNWRCAKPPRSPQRKRSNRTSLISLPPRPRDAGGGAATAGKFRWATDR